MKIKKLFPLLVATFFTISSSAFAFDGDISITGQNIKFSVPAPLEGQNNRIYATATNNSSKDLLGTVRFIIDGKQYGADQPISVFAGSSDGVFINWLGTPGNHTVDVIINPWEPSIDNPANNKISTSIYVTPDMDRDGIPNNQDPDIDGDGVANADDAFPTNPNESKDTDGDGTGDNSDNDDDGDLVPDEHDDLPLDPNENTDTDGDKIGDVADEDDDNDKLSDTQEEEIGTNPLDRDTDDDGTIDGEDAFPLDPEEQLDTDSDGIGNNLDIDDDNDGIQDDKDSHPLNKSPIAKIDEENKIIGVFDKHTFDATPSFDEDGKIVRYLWTIDGKSKEGNAVNYVFSKTGKHDVELTITDDQGQSASKNFQVSVFNIQLYKQILLLLLIIALASLLYFKYISEAKSKDKR